MRRIDLQVTDGLAEVLDHLGYGDRGILIESLLWRSAEVREQAAILGITREPRVRPGRPSADADFSDIEASLRQSGGGG